MGHPQIQQDTRKTRASCTCSVIDRLLEELVNEVAMGAVNLNPIKASPDGVSGRHSTSPGISEGSTALGGGRSSKGFCFLPSGLKMVYSLPGMGLLVLDGMGLPPGW